MNKTSIYLAGAINGLSYKEATIWRKLVYFALDKDKYQILDPMRGKEFLNVGQELINDSLLTKEVFERDVNDIDDSDIVLVNLAHLSDLKMIGSLWELGYSFRSEKMIVGFYCPNEYKNHPFIKNSINLFEKLGESLDYIEDLTNYRNKVFRNFELCN